MKKFAIILFVLAFAIPAIAGPPMNAKTLAASISSKQQSIEAVRKQMQDMRTRVTQELRKSELIIKGLQAEIKEDQAALAKLSKAKPAAKK